MMNGNHHASGKPFLSRDRAEPASNDEVRDARLTAYALGQLEGEAIHLIEAELKNSAAARKLVAEIQTLAQQLRDANRSWVVPPSRALRDAVTRRLEQAARASTTCETVVSLRAISPSPESRSRCVWRNKAVWAAAASLLIAAIGLWFVLARPKSEHVADRGPIDHSRAATDILSPSATVAALDEASSESIRSGVAEARGAASESSEPRGTGALSSETHGAGANSHEAPPPSVPEWPSASGPRSDSTPPLAPVVLPESASLRSAGAPASDARRDSASQEESSPRRNAEDRSARKETLGNPSAPMFPPSSRPTPKPTPEPSPRPQTLVAPPSALAQVPSRGWRHLAASKPGFLEVYLSTRPPDLASARPAPRPKKDGEAGLPGPQSGDHVASSPTRSSPLPGGPPALTGLSGAAGKSQPSETHLALPPGMRSDGGRPATDAKPGQKPSKIGNKPQTTPPERVSSDQSTAERPTMERSKDERFAADAAVENEFLSTTRYPYSAFSLGVDRQAYVAVSRYLQANCIPPPSQIQIEQLVNHFEYSDPRPTGDDLFAVGVEAADCPWARDHRLIRVAISSGPVASGDADRLREKANWSPIVDDVRVQVQFNPLQAASYRLIGYDNIQPVIEGVGDLPGGTSFAPGQTVVALYEVVPAPRPAASLSAAPSPRSAKSQRVAQRDLTAAEPSNVLLTVRVRYDRAGDKPHWLEVPWADPGQSFEAASPDFRFSAAVAAFGMILRGSRYCGDITLDAVEQIAESARGESRQRAEFLELIRIARPLLVERRQ